MLVVWCVAGLFMTAVGAEPAREVASDPAQADTQKSWLSKSGYGLMVHFGVFNVDKWPIEKYDELVEKFDIERFVDQVAETGASYVIWTLGQNSGLYCSPNATYDKLVGTRKTSKRDVPMELAKALEKRGIRMILYLPTRAPQRDEAARLALGDTLQNETPTQEFMGNWEAVCREWSLRYGSLVSGWWLDGYYVRDGWKDFDQPHNARTWSAALRAGNPDSILAFNPGSRRHKAFLRVNDFQDYTAGEMPDLSETPTSSPAPAGMEWQVLVYMGRKWGQGGQPRFDGPTLLQYIDSINAQGGSLTLDIPVSREGEIPEPFLSILKDLGKHREMLVNGRVDDGR
jgi:hypothetical protein